MPVFGPGILPSSGSASLCSQGRGLKWPTVPWCFLPVTEPGPGSLRQPRWWRCRFRGGCPRLGDCFSSRTPALAAFFPASAHPRGESAMTPRQGKRFRTSDQVEDLTVSQRHAAGIDVHAAVHFVAVAPADVPPGFVNPDAKLPAGVRKFAAMTADLEALAAWL